MCHYERSLKDGNSVVVMTKDNNHDKSLELLHQLLPDQFERIHKSYLVNFLQVDKVLVNIGTRYSVLLKTGEVLPVGRSKYKELKNKMI
ncbi:LytTR family DNA-binding domain-containing protein [Chryseobacterium sp. Bi04]|uniref:LytTR family DNA-binding domain-containing protein n=1 Tax=Chryseobacterium sp. Bi04 TaxID=2822345 RepID=UPI001E63DD5A|nr:LytTR family DNA-binding domain-containing protein [Chryseobacterium sp. Bi04]